MLNMIVWKSKPENTESIAKFLADGGIKPPGGVKIRSSVHGVGVGFVLIESDSLEPVYAMCAEWAPTLASIEHVAVIEEAAAHQILKQHRQK